MVEGFQFIGREKEIEDFKECLRLAKKKGVTITVTGFAGMGKTTLLNKYEEICNADKNVIVIRDEFKRVDSPLTLLTRIKDQWMLELKPKRTKIGGFVGEHRSHLEAVIDAIATGASLFVPGGGAISLAKRALPSATTLPPEIGFLYQAFIGDLEDFGDKYKDKILVIVLDEFHKNENQGFFIPFFNDVVEGLPEDIIFVVASRGKIVEKGLVKTEAQAKEFTEKESEEYLNKNIGITDERLVSLAYKRLRGHPYSLNLLRSIKNGSIEETAEIIDALPEQDVEDYLHEEVLRRMGEDEERLVQECCVLQTLDEDICSHMTGFDRVKCRRLLEELHKKSHLKKELGNLMLYDLFKDYLTKLEDKRFGELHQKAFEYFYSEREKSKDNVILLEATKNCLYHLENFDKKKYVEYAVNFSELFDLLGQYREAIIYLQKALNWELDDKDRAAALHNLGNFYLCLSDYDNALKNYKESLEIREKIGDIKGKAASLHQMGMIFEERGDYDNALKNYKESLEILEKIGDIKGKAYSLHQIGIIYQYKGEYENALKNYKESLEIAENIGDIRGKADSLHQIGRIFEEKGDYDKALKNYKKSLEIREKIGDIKGKASSLHQIGRIYQEKGEYDNALKNYKESLEIREKIGDINGKAISLAQIGVVNLTLGNHEDATRYFLRAYFIFDKLGVPYREKALQNLEIMKSLLSEQKFDAIRKEIENED